MIALALTLATLQQQAPAGLPQDAEAVYPAMPVLTPAEGSGVTPVVTIHASTATLTKDTVTFESLTLYKNTSATEGEVNLDVDFGSYRSGFGSAIKVEGKWSDQPLPDPQIVVRTPESTDAGHYTLRYKLAMKKNATHSLRLKFTVPVGKSGVDREERLIAYRVRDLGQTPALEQFRLSVKYNSESVFVPIGATPDWGWQIGANGAYLKLDGRKSDKDSLLVFRYYPPSF